MAFKVGDRVRRKVPNGYEMVVTETAVNTFAGYVIKDGMTGGESILYIGDYMRLPQKYFELLPPARPIRVGDRVMCIDGKNMPYLTEGKTYTVLAIPKESQALGVRGDDDVVWWYHTTRFALVDESIPQSESELPSQAQETELHRLVRVANEGRAAMIKIHSEYSREVRWENGKPLSGWIPESKNLVIKPKRPAATTLSTGWKVELDGNRVKIGCKTFALENLKAILNYLTSDTFTEDKYMDEDYGLLRFSAGRNGIHHEGYFLPWTDADKLLAYLEEHSGSAR